MRGQPFVQLLLVVLAFVALGLPVLRLTRPVPASAVTVAVPDGPPSAEVDLALIVTFVPAPEEFHLQHLGRDLLAGRGPQTEWNGTWKTSLIPEGADLALRVRWPAASVPAAARVVVRFPDDRPPLEHTFWSPGASLTELVTIPGPLP